VRLAQALGLPGAPLTTDAFIAALQSRNHQSPNL